MQVQENGATIAVIEPDRDFALVLAEVLRDDGHAVVTVPSCAKAAAILDAQSIDALVIDTVVALAEVTQLLEDQSRAGTEPLPVVFIGLEPPRRTTLHTAFVPIPFDLDDLLQAVASASAGGTGVPRITGRND
jgi:DNA-binding NtrC family response regulator